MTTVLITGTNRGLGLEFVRQYLDAGWHVIATCRDPRAATDLQYLGGPDVSLEIHGLDVADLAAIDALAAELHDVPIDVLINNAGVIGPKRRADDDFRQSFGQIDYDILAAVLRVNMMAPLKMAEAFCEHVALSEQKKIVTISSEMGSIAEGECGLYAYRISKAAVNMAMATVARDLETARVIVTLLNPGWVRTDMGGAAAPLDAGESVSCLRELIDKLTPDDSGAFIDHDGRRIPW